MSKLSCIYEISISVKQKTYYAIMLSISFFAVLPFVEDNVVCDWKVNRSETCVVGFISNPKVSLVSLTKQGEKIFQLFYETNFFLMMLT